MNVVCFHFSFATILYTIFDNNEYVLQLVSYLRLHFDLPVVQAWYEYRVRYYVPPVVPDIVCDWYSTSVVQVLNINTPDY